jgi:hypothetical protein
MPTQLYLYNPDTAGYALDDVGAGHNFAPLVTAGVSWLATAATPTGSPTVVYASDGGNRIVASTDAGSTWAIYTIAAFGSAPTIYASMVSHTLNDLHLFQHEPSAGLQGIWRSTNGGASWTRIVTTRSNQARRGGMLANGTNRLWYAESNGPLPLVSTSATFEIKSCAWDGSDIQLKGSITYSLPGGTVPRSLRLRAIDDTFCLVASPPSNDTTASPGGLHKVTAAGVVSSIRPSGLDAPWDVAMFDANTYVAAGTSFSDTGVGVASTIRLYRTINGGGSWTLVQSIPPTQGFALNGEVGNYSAWTMLEAAGASVAYMFGYADGATQLYLWKTSNAGTTWTSFRNQAALSDGSGGWLDYGLGGILAIKAIAPLVAIPSKLATIVG